MDSKIKYSLQNDCKDCNDTLCIFDEDGVDQYVTDFEFIPYENSQTGV